METQRIVAILREAFYRLSREHAAFPPPPAQFSEDSTLAELGVNEENISVLAKELRNRLGGIALNVELMFRLQQAVQGSPADMHPYRTLGDMARHIRASLHHGVPDPMVVYVDDEEENLFVFRRKFGKRMNLKTFADPREALEFIRATPEVVLVLTDEVMPGLTGNQLRDEAHRSRPLLRFILITGNPGGDENLMQRSLRQERFYDFFNKPLDLENKSEEYFEAMNRVVTGTIL